MNETGKQHKAAWEYDAYNFWVEHSGTPQERAAEDKADPVRMLRKYAAYFDRYEGVRIANICGSCGKKAVPLALLGAFVFHWPVLLVYACTCLDEVGKIPWVMAHFRKYKWVKDLTIPSGTSSNT